MSQSRNPDSTPKNTWLMRILSQNVDDHPGYRFPNGRLGYISHAFPELSFENRFPLFEAFYQSEIQDNHVNLFALQEMSDNAKKLFEPFFEKAGFECITTKYNNDKESLNYMIAYKKSDYTVKKKNQIYFTTDGKSYSDQERADVTAKDKANKTRELFDHNFDTEFEKSAQIIVLSQKNNHNAEFVIVNIQPGLTNKHRELVMEKLCSELKNETRPTLAVGDFNQFDSSKQESAIHHKQIAILKENGFNWDTEHLMDEGIKSTFISHPFDILRFFKKDTMVSGITIPGDFTRLDTLKEKKDHKGIRNLFLEVIEREKLDLVSTCLDAEFSRNFDKSVKIDTESHSWFAGKLVNTAQANRGDLQKLVLKGLFADSSNSVDSSKMEEEKLDNAPPRPSDHTAIIITVNAK
jgi:hypothetical protein